MKKRSEGLLLGLTFVVGAATLVQDYRLTQTTSREQQAALAVEQDFGAMEAALAAYRGAQAAYLSANVPLGTWTARADTLSAEVESTLTRLRQSGAPLAAPQYEAALGALEDLGARDAQARALVRSGSPFEASDVIFSESTDALERLSAALAEARRIERADASSRLTLTSRIRMGVVAGAMVFLLAVLVFFRRRRAATESDAAVATTSPAQGTLGLSGAAVPAAASARIKGTAAKAPAATTSAAAGRGSAESGVNLSDAADVCVDLARVIDGRDVAALLERAMAALGAQGGVLWVADAGASVLRPTFASGYPEHILAKLGALPVEADNATSIAFRSMRTQVVRAATPSSRGAIAVPLVTSSGCVGVLSAEVPSTDPSQETLAVARIIAAQVAAIVTPASGSTMAAQA
jgi:hypothetical protein